MAVVFAPTAFAQQPAGAGAFLLRGSGAPEPVYDSAALAPNYAKPRPKRDQRARYSGRRAIAGRKLPAMEAYRTAPASVRTPRTAPAPGVEPVPAPNFAMTAAGPTRRPAKVEDDSYAQLGLRSGGMIVKPSIDVEAGYDANPRRTAAKEGSPVLRGGLGFTAASEWSRHQFTAEATASYLGFTRTPDADRPDAAAKANLRLDVFRDSFANFELRGALTTQRPGSPDVPGATTNQPLVASFGATTGLTQRFGRTEASVSFLADRRVYGDAELAGGGVSRLSQDNYNSYGVRGRIAYEYTPGVKPFLEAGADVRRRDEAIDASGFDRDSSGFLTRAGSTFELTRTLTGEASAGYAQRVYNDKSLPVLAGPTFDGKLAWSATPLTTVTLRAATQFNETTVAGASGSISRVAGADVSHALFRNFTVGAGLTYTDTRYDGAPIAERAWVGALRGEYAFTRYLRMRGSYAYEKLDSTQPGAGFDAHVFLLGLRLTP